MNIAAEHTATHHFVDDLALVDGFCRPWDLAMDSIRFNGHLPVDHFTLLRDGRVMVFDITGSKIADSYECMISLLIRSQQLPLRMRRDRFCVGKVVFHDKLVITYEQQ